WLVPSALRGRRILLIRRSLSTLDLAILLLAESVCPNLLRFSCKERRRQRTRTLRLHDEKRNPLLKITQTVSPGTRTCPSIKTLALRLMTALVTSPSPLT